jgi:L-lactate utilization protein LutC
MARSEAAMNSRDQMLAGVRAALGRTANHPLPPPPTLTQADAGGDLIRQFTEALTALAGEVVTVTDLARARAYLEPMLAGRRVIVSSAPILEACGLRSEYSREACAAADIGVTSADFALADTGTLVFLSESHESRLISLLPPRHIAVIERSKILSGLDELLTRIPLPAGRSSSMVLVTGPSRTGDIEMRLVRGVHGPGESLVIIVDHVTP